MPVVYIHGVAVRDKAGSPVPTNGNKLLERLLEDITWAMVAERLRRFVAPAISAKPESVSLIHAYWGDLAVRLAWDGLSCLPDMSGQDSLHTLPRRIPARSRLMADVRQPINQLGAQFFGDVFCYLNERGDWEKPGPIPQRILTTLEEAQKAKGATSEPLVVVTNSMGGQIVYDIVSYFLPRNPKYANLHIDYWCSVASQIGLFEEMKLFLSSSPDYSKAKGNRVPFPDRNHLGTWWNVWDVDDLISYSVRDIIEGVDDTPFRVGASLMKEHIGYLQSDRFYLQLAERLRKEFPQASKGEGHATG